MDFENLPFETIPETKVALEAAIKAGEAVLEIYNRDFSSELKKDKEPLTEADIKSNEILIDALSETGHHILSEEEKDDEKRLDEDKIWIIDPLDGTNDFINKTGEFSIMIALVEEHKPILGIIYQPTTGVIYVAQKGCGAYKNDGNGWSKIGVSSVFELKKCRAVGSRHHLAQNEKDFLGTLKISDFRQKGSCLKVTEISQGNAELYFTTTDKIKQWDTCASYCIIKESGGNMTDMFGNELKYNTKVVNHENGILVTNGKIHEKIIEKYEGFIKK